ncbi:MAG TPA: hypothetical protein DCL77_11585, partial [Prolixibacteraceae bacterium]|nr:hypothetical protein [Prolixibacteraceae bacterium]
MEALALYLIKSTVWLTGFALVYLLFLRNERFFVLNRIYLVSGIIVSIVFPLLTWHYTVIIPNAPTVEVSDLQMVGTVELPEPFPTQAILLYIYLAGALYLLYRVTRQTMSVLRVIRKSEILPYRSAKLIRTTEYPASFSFFSFVFVNPSTCDTETNEIMNHEMEHIRQQHWIDLLLFECLCTLQWYNPMSWLYGRFIRQNHEYLADERALQRTTNPAIYRAALLNQMFGGPVITLANSFNYSINKKRFNMMKKTIYSPIRKFKLLLILPLMAGVFYAFATPEYKYAQSDVNSAQQTEKIITGKVMDEKGNPLKGSAVVISGTNIGTITDDYGIFKLKLTDNSPIVISHVGYDSQKLNPDTEKEMIITLKPVNTGLDEVTVTAAYRGNSDQATLGPTIKVQTNSPLNFGNADGSSAQPLIVIDGVITENANINNIPPETIESINVLKDESATKLYGEKGKNGVILITKKKGSPTSQNNLIDVNIVQDAKAQKGSDVYTVVEQMPEFPGGEMALRKFLAYNIKYPRIAAENGIQGKEFVSFVITKTGSVADAIIVMGVDPSLDQEALRVIQSMPNWIPGKQNGENVDVVYTVPINFKLESSKINTEKLQDTGTPSDQPYSVVEQMPEFPGGPEALRTFIANTVRYPALAHENGIQGKVYINFVVTKTGSVTNAKVVRGVDPLLDQEAIRVVELLPAWIPGKQNGENVNVNYTIPIDFKMEPGKINTEKLKGTDIPSDQPYSVVEQMPEFPGGIEALRAYVSTTMKYPAIAYENGIQGQVYVKFEVDKTGRVTNVKISRSVDPALDQEAMRIVKSMPAWTPGKQNGENVAVAYELPINFKLPSDWKMKKEKLALSYQTGIKPEDQAADSHKLINNGFAGNAKVRYSLENSDYD